MQIRHPVLTRAANKLKREVYRLPAIRVYRAYEYHEALEAHALRLPSLDPGDLGRLEGLRRDGVVIVPVESLGLPGTQEMLAACETLAGELRAMARNGESASSRSNVTVMQENAPRLSIERVMRLPEIYLWGLGERLLSLIENYVGLPIRYHGADLRREIADGKPNDVRQWHIDAEDHRMFKIILYLNDVEPGGGPFEYIPRATTIETAKRLRYSSGFVKDDDMDAALPRARWVQALGKARTACLADTCKIFHRAQPARDRDRYSITYSWTSTTAIKTYPTMPLSEENWAYIMSHTNERQRVCLPPRS
jgi:hypothetical protein